MKFVYVAGAGRYKSVENFDENHMYCEREIPESELAYLPNKTVINQLFPVFKLNYGEDMKQANLKEFEIDTNMYGYQSLFAKHVRRGKSG